MQKLCHTTKSFNSLLYFFFDQKENEKFLVLLKEKEEKSFTHIFKSYYIISRNSDRRTLVALK